MGGRAAWLEGLNHGKGEEDSEGTNFYPFSYHPLPILSFPLLPSPPLPSYSPCVHPWLLTMAHLKVPVGSQLSMLTGMCSCTRTPLSSS